jgi:hypothetical protein
MPEAGVHGAGHAGPITDVHAPVGVQQNVTGIATKQKTWLHVTPGLGEVPVGQTCPAYTCVHPPVELLQHAVTHGLLGVHVAPSVHVPAQSDCTETVQLTAPNWQHDPIGGHGPADPAALRHDWATDWIQPCGQDCVFTKIWQTPVVTLQQTTDGGMHGVDGHDTPTPRNTPGAGHAVALATVVHWPVA